MHRTKLAVLGSPIAHSLSPRLHRAAYHVLGLRWDYDAIEVDEASLPRFFADLDDGWRGLSLTMPLKHAVLDLPLTRVSDTARSTGSANTLTIGSDGVGADNTDVFGIVSAVTRASLRPTPGTVQVIGAGATAASAVVAASRLGSARVHLSARAPDKAERLRALGRELGVVVVAGRLDDAPSGPVDLVISTLPGGSDTSMIPLSSALGSTLLDVAYHPWPSELATRFAAAGGEVISGLEMLVHQAIAQIRLFTAADSTVPLPDEPSVLAAMRSAVGLR